MSKKLTESAMSPADYTRYDWVVTADLETTPEDILKPLYWAHVAHKMRQWHEVQVRAADATWLAELIVVAAGPQWVKVMPKHDLLIINRKVQIDPDVTAKMAEDYEVKYRGAARWSVIRKIDRVVMHENSADKADAERFLEKLVTQVA